MNLPSCQILSVLGIGIGSLRVQKISKNGYWGRVEQGRGGVNPWWGGCVVVGCSNLDGREKVKNSNTGCKEKNGGHRERQRHHTRTQVKAMMKSKTKTKTKTETETEMKTEAEIEMRSYSSRRATRGSTLVARWAGM